MNSKARKKIRLHLAPMEGVVDWIVRDQLTQIGGIDHCVTEFVRITDHLIPDFLFHRYCPELKTQGRTFAGTPVFVQLLGSDPGALAINAKRATDLGAIGIDLNFGCPAKIVNRHEGGAALLKSPDTIYNIVSEVRKSVPNHIPVTAKIRLGFDDPNACFENAKAIESAGATWLTIHCRTKTDMYKPPAYWEWIPKIKEKSKIPIVANGEIWNFEDAQKCANLTGCQELMIGRGALANPFVFSEIKSRLEKQDQQLQQQQVEDDETSFNSDLSSTSNLNSNLNMNLIMNLNQNLNEKNLHQLEFLRNYFLTCESQVSPFFAQARSKMWLKNFSSRNSSFTDLFDKLKVVTDPSKFKDHLFLQEK